MQPHACNPYTQLKCYKSLTQLQRQPSLELNYIYINMFLDVRWFAPVRALNAHFEPAPNCREHFHALRRSILPSPHPKFWSRGLAVLWSCPWLSSGTSSLVFRLLWPARRVDMLNRSRVPAWVAPGPPRVPVVVGVLRVLLGSRCRTPPRLGVAPWPLRG